MVKNRIQKTWRKVWNSSYLYSDIITNVTTQQPVVALTFDDGPHPVYTPELLDMLKRRNAKATFFVTGECAQRHPEILDRMAQDGHAIGNHSWDHASFPMINSRNRRLQIKKCQSILGSYDSGLFRPPYGHLNLLSRLDVFLSGSKIVGWNVQVEDWLDHPVEKMFTGLKKKLKPGAIVLLHDNLFYTEDLRFQSRTASFQALGQLLAEETGFEFVTVLELLKRGKIVSRPMRGKGDPVWLDKLIRSPMHAPNGEHKL